MGLPEYIAFIDECGDHSMEVIDRDFPIFVLSTIIVERKSYCDLVIPAFNKLKLTYWDHEGIILHSRDIRKARGQFRKLHVPDIRQSFMQELSSLMETLPYWVFVSCIRKDYHKSKYGSSAISPYNLALVFNLERICGFLKRKGIFAMTFVAEARGKNEDEDLELVFFRVMSQGTEYTKAEEFKRRNCSLVFEKKRHNIIGIQLADLVAHPCARHILKPHQKNRAFEIVNQKIYCEEGLKGWKVFP